MSKTHLAFEISEHACSLASLEDGRVNFIGNLQFDGKKDFQYKESLLQFLKEKNLAELQVDDVSVSWVSPNATLVPTAIFQSGSAEAIFSACFNKQVAANDIDYNRLTESAVVNVYEIPMWVKSFFVVRFPRVNILHEYSHLIKGLFHNGAFKLQIQASIHPEQLSLLIVKNNELLFANSFEVNHHNDVIYYLSFVVQQLKLGEQEGILTFSIAKNVEQIKADALQKDLEKINLFRGLKPRFEDEKPFKYHQFCV